jgi:hypothetical protein
MKNKNTYSLLVQSDEKGRSIFESAIYGLVVLSIAFTSWQFASGSVVVPGMNRANDKTSSGIAVEVVEPAVQAPVIASR